MRRPPPRLRNEDDRILPLINVVFLLMIFFLLAGRIPVPDAFQVEPARSASASASESREMIVLVGADGRLALDGQPMDAATFKTAVAAWAATHARGPVRLKADSRTEAAQVVGVMEILREAGIEKLKLLALPELR